MIQSAFGKFAEDIGFDIANSDDVTQAKLLNGLCDGLVNSMTPEQLNTQICYIAQKINPKTSRVLFELVEFLKLKGNF